MQGCYLEIRMIAASDKPFFQKVLKTLPKKHDYFCFAKKLRNWFWWSSTSPNKLFFGLNQTFFLKKEALPRKDYFCFAKTAYMFLVKCYFTKETCFWIKPFFKRFDVSILVFVDDFCNIIYQKIRWNENTQYCFNPCFRRRLLQHLTFLPLFTFKVCT